MNKKDLIKKEKDLKITLLFSIIYFIGLGYLIEQVYVKRKEIESEYFIVKKIISSKNKEYELKNNHGKTIIHCSMIDKKVGDTIFMNN